MEQPTEFDIMMNPSKYGYEECHHCNGYGSSLLEDSAKCTQCGGTGMVKGRSANLPA
jgi:DnaJ-class molecular chaperone